MTGFFIASRPILAYLIECRDSKNYCFAFLICNVICAFLEAKIGYFFQLQYSLLNCDAPQPAGSIWGSRRPFVIGINDKD